MTVDEIFGQIAQHMIQGTMVHEQLANYYDFLGLNGYKRMHEYHYFDESCAYRGLCRYYINHHNKLVPKAVFENPNIIPDSWYKHKRQDVDNATKSVAIKTGTQLWVDWEKETKKLYQDMYTELMNIGEAASALKVKELLCDADCELKKAERFALEKKGSDYNMADIISEQETIHDKYRKKLKKIGVYVC